MRVYPRIYILVHVSADGHYVEGHSSFESAKDAAKDIVMTPEESLYQRSADELSIFNLTEDDGDRENLLTEHDIIMWEDERETLESEYRRYTGDPDVPKDEEEAGDEEDDDERKKIVRRHELSAEEEIECLEEEAVAMMDVQAPPKEGPKEKARVVRVEEDTNRPVEG